MTERKIAFDILTKISDDKSYSNLELNKSLENADPRTRAFVTNLVYGTIQNRMRIDCIIGAYSSVPLKKLSPDVLTILRMGIYQIIYTNKIPMYAIINESVELARLKSLKGFVNGMLRSISRNDKPVNYPSKKLDFLSVYYSCPKWICEKWVSMFGVLDAEKLIKSMAEAPSFSARINTLKTDIDTFLQGCDTAKKDGLTDAGILFEGGINISENFAHKNGEFYIQDTSSMIPCEVLAPKKGETVFDVCAAPGGKTTYLSQIMQNTGSIAAFDIYPHKIELIQNNAKRLGCTNITAVLENAAQFNKQHENKADKILVDAPCSGLGILRRKPEIKYEKTENDIKEITQLQSEILNNAAKYLKPGGEMVYSTCTINDDENEKTVAAFLNAHKDFSLIPIKTNHIEEKSGILQLLPSVHGCDGFFAAHLKKAE